MKRHSLSMVVIVAACALALPAHAMVQTSSVHTTVINTYTDYGGGDVVFQVDAPIAGCYGFWLPPSDGFKQVYAALLMAKAASAIVVVYADETQLWSGSGSNYCRVHSLSPQ